MKSSLPFFALLALSACDAGHATPDADAATDAAALLDLGTPTADAAAPPDAAVPPDAAIPPTPDAAAPDAATPDAAAPPGFYAPAAEAAIADAVTADLDRTLATGAQIAVWHGGALVYVRSFGFRDPASTEPVDDDTVFQIGSDTKKMTAVLALQQVAAGRMTLGSTVAETLPGLTLAASPEWAGQATLHDLLSHQGGLYDYTPWTEDPSDASLGGIARGDFAANVWAMAPPGAFWNYANPNFSMAGYMTETVAGRPWPDLAEQDLFAPLGLTHTFARREEAVATGDYALGTGVIVGPDGTPSADMGPVDLEHTIDNGFLRPAGLVWSTASDMATFGAFFLHGDTNVLPDDLRTAMTTQQVRMYPAIDFQGYGYGWMTYGGFTIGQSYYAQPMWQHGGNTMSETSLTWVLPEEDLSISILSNGYGDDFTLTGVALLAQSGLLPAQASPPPVYPTAETDHARLAGTYAEHQVGDLIFSNVDGKLTVDIPQAAALGLEYTPALDYAGATDIYILHVAGQDLDVTFIPDDTGEYRYARNRSFVGIRNPDAPRRSYTTPPRHRWSAPDAESRRFGPGLPAF